MALCVDSQREHSLANSRCESFALHRHEIISRQLDDPISPSPAYLSLGIVAATRRELALFFAVRSDVLERF